jgi:hypothetical protein
MKVDGQCHCGAITFEAEVDPERVYVCHCTDCQSISGSPFRWATNVPKGDFRLLSGSPKTYVKQAESGDENHQVFCPDCASPIYSTSSRDDWKSAAALAPLGAGLDGNARTGRGHGKAIG